MFPYWLLFSIFALGAVGWDPSSRQNRPTPMLMIAAALMVLLIGFRWEVGADWFPYERMYAEISQWGVTAAFEITEPLYGLLNLFADRFGLGIWAVNMVCSMLFAWGLVRFAQLQPNPWLAIVVAIPFLAIVVAMGFTRQGAAIGLAMLALVALRNNSIRKSIFFVLLASTFHRSALVLVPLIGISNTQNRFQALFFTLMASVLGYIFLLDSAVDRYSTTYVEQVYQADGAAPRLAMNVIPALVVLFFSRRLQLEGTERRLWIGFAVLGLLLNVMLVFISSTVALDRIGIYVIPMQMMVFSRLPLIYDPKGEPSKLITFGIVAYSAAVQFVWLNFASNAEYWLPYRFIFFK